ncbi:MAG: hypothetical protein JRJ15_01930 [Deltaproteobacteria bacterium]|nr:hypothetical protein [Deltaproteobacteria bacterium]
MKPNYTFFGLMSIKWPSFFCRLQWPCFPEKTDLLVEAAKFYNITLIDLAKNTNRVYSHARRIEGF